MLRRFLDCIFRGAYSPPQLLMVADLHAPSTISVLAGITTFTGGFGLAPMFLAPFSEINGRYPVFVVSGVLYVIAQMLCGLVRNVAGMLIARLLTGIGGSVFSTMVGGVIADIWQSENRNTPMALFSGAVLVGTGAGPLIAAITTHRLNYGEGPAAGWKWIFWHQVILAAVLMAALILFFKESRGSVLLSRKAKALNRWYDELEDAGYYGVWVDEQPTLRNVDFDDKELDEEKRITIKETRRLQRIRWIVKEDEDRTSSGK